MIVYNFLFLLHNLGLTVLQILQGLTTGLIAIYSTYSAFAALKNDGTVVTWADSDFGGDSSKVSSQLTDVVSFSPSY